MNRLVITMALACFVSHGAIAKQYLRDNEWDIAEWKVIRTVKGDLNNDGVSDTVSAGEEVNPDNLKKNDNYGAKVLNLNPRDLTLIFGTHWAVVVKRLRSIIFSQASIVLHSHAYPTLLKGVTGSKL